MSTRVVLCPGQGAQAVGMGQAWFDRSPEAKAVFERAERVLGDRLGTPLTSLCFDGPEERLNRTDASQPAIYVASMACWHGLLARWQAGAMNGAAEAGVSACAGLSLGEYTALAIAGVFSFEDGLELVALRGRAMQDAADAVRLADGSPGSSMVALIGVDEAQASIVCERARGGEVLVCANFNAPGQIVLSGSIAACRRAVEFAGELGLRATPLPVAGAFHSPLMRPAAERLAEALRKTPMRPPACAVLSNVTGEPHPNGTHGADPVEAIRARLVDQLTSAVRWEQNARWLAKTYPGAAVIELAPGKTLAGLMRRIDKLVKVESAEEPA